MNPSGPIPSLWVGKEYLALPVDKPQIGSISNTSRTMVFKRRLGALYPEGYVPKHICGHHEGGCGVPGTASP